MAPKHPRLIPAKSLLLTSGTGSNTFPCIDTILENCEPYDELSKSSSSTATAAGCCPPVLDATATLVFFCKPSKVERFLANCSTTATSWSLYLPDVKAVDLANCSNPKVASFLSCKLANDDDVGKIKLFKIWPNTPGWAESMRSTAKSALIKEWVILERSWFMGTHANVQINTTNFLTNFSVLELFNLVKRSTAISFK